jgi:hypothetical protein
VQDCAELGGRGCFCVRSICAGLAELVQGMRSQRLQPTSCCHRDDQTRPAASDVLTYELEAVKLASHSVHITEVCCPKDSRHWQFRHMCNVGEECRGIHAVLKAITAYTYTGACTNEAVQARRLSTDASRPANNFCWQQCMCIAASTRTACRQRYSNVPWKRRQRTIRLSWMPRLMRLRTSGLLRLAGNRSESRPRTH